MSEKRERSCVEELRLASTLCNLHDLEPCATCDVRMAVPGVGLCTVCDLELPCRVPDSPTGLTRAADPPPRPTETVEETLPRITGGERRP